MAGCAGGDAAVDEAVGAQEDDYVVLVGFQRGGGGRLGAEGGEEGDCFLGEEWRGGLVEGGLGGGGRGEVREGVGGGVVVGYEDVVGLLGWGWLGSWGGGRGMGGKGRGGWDRTRWFISRGLEVDCRIRIRKGLGAV